MNLIASNKYLLLGAIVKAVFSIGGAYTYFIKSELEKVQASYLDQGKELAIEKANNTVIKATIESQNNAIESQKVEYSEKLQELEDWKNKPSEIKYKEVIKFKEVKSNECEDIKNIINSMRSTSF